MRIAIIGAGWYGSHLAATLGQKGHQVVLFEKNPQIFSEISGTFGVRLHAGPHYPRSESTRKHCHHDFIEFSREYPDLINKHEYSIYALGIRDADNQPSKVSEVQFTAVCKEFGNCKEVNLENSGYQNILMAMDIQEPSLALGSRLRTWFEHQLKETKVEVCCDEEVINIEKENNGLIVTSKKGQQKFDYVINTTSYKSLLPNEILPLRMEIVYQPCLALVYEDKKQSLRPFSFIVMDGWFPCIMPYDDRPSHEKLPSKRYIVTHGKWTIMGSHKTLEEANNQLASVDDSFISTHVKPNCENDIMRFWPEFEKRFVYIKWIGAVMAKIKTEKEFRSAVIFQHTASGIIYVIPGKVSNIFDVEKEVSLLLSNRKVTGNKLFRYVKDGILDQAAYELIEKPIDLDRNTCELQTYKALQGRTFFSNNQNKSLSKENSLTLKNISR